MKITVWLLVVGVMLCQTARADLTVDKQITITDPVSGKTVSHETVLVREDDYAVNDMQFQGHEVRTVVEGHGEELLLINYEDLTYSLFDDYLIDSLISGRKGLDASESDSIRKHIKLNRLELDFTGRTRDFYGIEARELQISVDLTAKAPLLDESIMPLRIVIRGNEWISTDFPVADTYSHSRRFLSGMPSSMTRNLFGDYSEILRSMDASDSVIDHVFDIFTYLVLEGSLYLTIEMGASGQSDLKGEPVPAMSWTMKFETSCLNISFDKVLDEEFEIPRGFRKVHNAFSKIGTFVIPGLEKWFALDKDV